MFSMHHADELLSPNLCEIGLKFVFTAYREKRSTSALKW
jgi:hypothetical protein